MRARYLQGAPRRYSRSGRQRQYRLTVIPLPRPLVLTSAILLGVATGLLGGTAALTVEHARMRPDVAIALVGGFPSAVGLLVVLLARRHWLTALGAFIAGPGSGWVGGLAPVEVATRGCRR